MTCWKQKPGDTYVCPPRFFYVSGVGMTLDTATTLAREYEEWLARTPEECIPGPTDQLAYWVEERRNAWIALREHYRKLGPKMITALQLVPECLEDWIETTGHGEVNRRDRNALAAVNAVLEQSKEVVV